MDDVTAAKMNFRKEQWKQLILERQASGLSINNWCQQHGFKRTTYFYWLRRIRQEACQTLPEPQAWIFRTHLSQQSGNREPPFRRFLSQYSGK